MFLRNTKQTVPSFFNLLRFSAVFFICLIGCPLSAQKQDEKMLDDYIKAFHTHPIILFDAANIKQFWIESSVISSNDEIKIILNNTANTFESVPLKIQLKNVLESQDCKIEVFTKQTETSFSVNDSKLRKLSISQNEAPFLDYNVLSSSFSLEKTSDFIFNLVFSSNTRDPIIINKIVLSFSQNKTSSFCSSPGVIHITDENIIAQGNAKIEKSTENSFSMTGKSASIRTKNNIYCDGTAISFQVKVKNIGQTPTRVYTGYEVYDKAKNYLYSRNYPYKKTSKVIKVLSSEKDSNTIEVDSYTEWGNNCTLAMNAKDDYSDIPNFSFVEGNIVDIKKKENSAEIVLDKPLKKAIPPGTCLRVHFSGSRVYPATQLLQPGEEAVFSATLEKDNDSFFFSNRAFPHGSYFVKPVLYSVSVDTKEENSVLISDYVVSY